MTKSIRIHQETFIPFVTVFIWGSLYVASRLVLPGIPALLLLFLRFSISSILLISLARKKNHGRRLRHFQREDLGELLLVGFFGYFISNAALLFGIQYTSSSFSSLINAMNPVFISLFAVLLLKEKMSKKALISLVITVLGAAVIIGTPDGSLNPLGVGCCFFSVILWSFTTIHIKKLTAKYPPLMVTGYGMGIAAVFALPAALTYLSITHTEIRFSGTMVLPLLYICIVCTALSHAAWNYALSITPAARCASFYPVQPISSMLLGILLLHEKTSPNFFLGALLIILPMLRKKD